MEIAQILINGVLIGGLYGLIGISASMNFGIMKIVNLFVGDITILGAYVCFFLLSSGMFQSPFLTLLVIIPLFFIGGYLIQKFLINKTLGKGELPPLLVTFGIATIIQNSNLEIFTSDNRTILAGDLSTASIEIGGVYIPVIYTICLASALIVLTFIHLLLTKTNLGRNLRAVVDDSSTAQMMGINPTMIYAIASGLAFVFAGIAGLLYGIAFTFEPTTGSFVLLIALEAVAIGGMGSLKGTLLGGIVLGVAQLVGSALIGPNYGLIAGHIVFIIVIIFKPQGILSK